MVISCRNRRAPAPLCFYPWAVSVLTIDTTSGRLFAYNRLETQVPSFLLLPRAICFKLHGHFLPQSARTSTALLLSLFGRSGNFSFFCFLRLSLLFIAELCGRD